MAHEELQPEDVDVSISPLHGALKRTWCAFCNTSSIHGLKYANDKETNRYIRFIWILIILLMFFCAIATVVTFYMEYNSNPTRMNVASDNALVSNLIFPPTIVCPSQIYNTRKSIEFLQTLIIPNSTSVLELNGLLYYLYHFIFESLSFQQKYINLLEEILVRNNLSIMNFIEHINWDCEDILFRCRFKNEIVPCNELFQITHTYRGHCCSFNFNTNPRSRGRYTSAGLSNGLSIILYYNSNQEMFHFNGFKIIIQEIDTYVTYFSTTKTIPIEREVFLSVQPREYFCSQAVKDLSFENRLCVFPHEKKLEYVNSYKGANCKINCRIKKVLEICHCYTYFFYNARIEERLCSFKDIPCLQKNFAKIIGRYKNDQCMCYRNCENIAYDVQLSSAPLRLDTPTIDEFYNDINEDYSVVHIYFNSQTYRRVRHDLLLNMVSLVSNLGSAFSLFVGMSMISAIEIIYYFSIILNKFYQQECRARLILSQRNANHMKE